MTTYVDLGAFSWCGGDVAWAQSIVDDGGVFCVDSWNIRKTHLPWYKSQRAGNEALYGYTDKRERATEVQAAIRYWFPESCLSIEGAEGDDVMAIHAGPGDTLVTLDKDMLVTVHGRLTDFSGAEWGLERMVKYTKLPLSRGNAFLAYQLMHGDVADNVPRRLLTRDRYTAKWVMAQANPLLAAVQLLPEDLARDSLAALCMPTPLLYGLDPIEFALERWPAPNTAEEPDYRTEEER